MQENQFSQLNREVFVEPDKPKRGPVRTIIIIVLLLGVAALGWWLINGDKEGRKGEPIEVVNKEEEASKGYPLANEGNISSISGIACEYWNRRPVAVMQPSDVQARPAAGFFDADMVIEMPAYTSSVTRLMGVYQCSIPEEIGAMRSSRHDYLHIAKGLDAVFVCWGGSAFSLNKLNENVIDSLNCNGDGGTSASGYCDRWPLGGTVKRVEDSGHIKRASLLEAIDHYKYRTENKFSGYSHQGEAPVNDRPQKGHLRVAFAKPYDVEYDYDRETNSYLRTWSSVPDTDRNSNKRLAPKNVVVMFAKSEQISLDQDYVGKGLEDPWKAIPEEKKTAGHSIDDRYNNVQLGDPWYDEFDSGEAYYYMNGKEIKGSWKKDKARMDSKLLFFDEAGNEIKFVPGQIWVEILEPGQALRWAAE